MFSRKYWASRMIDAAMDRPDLKVALFRFIDVLPSLSSPEAISRHIREYFKTDGPPLPWVVRALLRGAASSVTAPVASRLIRRNLTSFSKTFIAGDSPAARSRRCAGSTARGGRSPSTSLGRQRYRRRKRTPAWGATSP